MQYYLFKNLFQMTALTPGRRAISLQRMQEKLPGVAGSASLASIVAEALAAQTEAMEVLSTWYREQRDDTLHDPGARDARLALTRSLSTFHSALEGLRDSARPELAALASALVTDLFPRDLAGNTSLPWVDQHADTARILARVASPEFQTHREKLALGLHLDRLAELNAALGEKLSRAERITYEEAQAENAKAEDAFLGVCAAICGQFYRSTPADVEARKDLLEPVFTQVTQLRALRQARRAEKAQERAAAKTKEQEDLEADVGMDLGDSPSPGASASEPPPSASAEPPPSASAEPPPSASAEPPPSATPGT